MGKERLVEIKVFGQVYTVKTDAKEDHIQKVAQYVNEKMDEVTKNTKSVSSLNVAILTALNIADELFLSQKKLDQLNEAIGHMETEIESLEVHLSEDENTYKSLGKVNS